MAAGGRPGRTTAPAAHWEYSGAAGPGHWGSLDPGYRRCADGSAQSPVALVHPERVPLPDLGFGYHPGGAVVQDTGHTVQADFPPGSTLTLDGRDYALRQVHFHVPAEHEVEGTSYPAEMHFVHQADGGDLAVVAAFVETSEGGDHPAWQRLLDAFPDGTADGVDPAALLRPDRTSIRYHGSLTTPPCREGVRWNVLAQPLRLSRRQVARLRARYPHNRRPLQRRNGRRLLLDSSDGD